MNLIGEGVDAARRRLGIKVPERTVPRRAKIGVAVAVVLLSALVGFPVFELISPIGAVNKGLVFGGLARCGHAFGHRYRRAARQPSFVVPGAVPLGRAPSKCSGARGK